MFLQESNSFTGQGLCLVALAHASLLHTCATSKGAHAYYVKAASRNSFSRTFQVVFNTIHHMRDLKSSSLRPRTMSIVDQYKLGCLHPPFEFDAKISWVFSLLTLTKYSIFKKNSFTKPLIRGERESLKKRNCQPQGFNTY